MRNLKKLLAVVVAICVLATFTVPAFAADAAAAKTDSQICTDLGVIKGAGTGVTAEYLATQPDRLQGAIMFLRLKGLEDTAKAFIGTDNFADVEGLSDTNKAILAYLKANPDLGFAGVGDNKFSPLTKMSAKEYYKVMLVALGYVYDTDFKWANVFSFAASKGLTGLIDNESFTVADLCKGTVEALKATVKGGTDTLIAKLVAGGSIAAATATASGLYNAVPKALELVSATADNFKAAKFVFNQELNSDTVKKENFTGPTLNKVVLLDDKKTVIVVLDAEVTEQSKSIDITVKNVKSASGMTIAETKKSVTFVDNTIPVISGATAKNAKTIVINASEPIKATYLENYVNSFSGIKIDGTAINAVPVYDYAKNTLTLNLVNLLSAGTHKIEVGSLKDFAGYVAVTQTYNFDVAADTTAPEITAGKVNSPTEIEVTFSEDVDTNNQGSFKVNGEDVKSKAQSADDHSKFTLTLNDANKLTVGATVEINVKYKDQQDVVGNKTAEKTYTFKIADDTTLPTVTASIDSDNDITLSFSKAMLHVGTMKVYKSDGTTQLGSNVDLSTTTNIEWKSGNNAVEIKAAAIGNTDLSSTDAKDIKIKLTDLKDATVRANALAETVIGLKANDTKAPTVQAYYTVDAKTASDAADDTITFIFSESMNADSIKELANYYVVTPAGTTYTAAKALSAYSDVSIDSVSSDNTKVTIKAKGIAADKPGFQVYAMKDVAGKAIAATNVSYVGAGHTFAMTGTPKATAGNTIEVTFDGPVKEFQPGAFIVVHTSGEAIITGVNSGSIDGSKVTLTLAKDIGTSMADVSLKLQNPDYIKDFYGTAVSTISPIAVTDEVKPTVTFAATSAGITVKFSEQVTLTPAGFAANEVILTKGGKAVTPEVTSIGAVYVDGDKYCYDITGLEKNADYVIKLFPRGYVVDRATTPNMFAPTTETTITTKW